MALKVVPKYRKSYRQISSLLAEQNMLSLLSDNSWFLDLHASWADSQNFYYATVRGCSLCLSYLLVLMDGCSGIAPHGPLQGLDAGGQARPTQSPFLHGGIGLSYSFHPYDMN
jgi:hypothetical protein